MTKPPITVAACLEIVSREFGVSVEILRGDRRNSTYSRYRRIAMWLARRATGLSLPEIGRDIGDRDHTTILEGIRRIEYLRDTGDIGLTQTCDRLLKKLRQEYGGPLPKKLASLPRPISKKPAILAPEKPGFEDYRAPNCLMSETEISALYAGLRYDVRYRYEGK